jgi:hypothetical protein
VPSLAEADITFTGVSLCFGMHLIHDRSCLWCIELREHARNFKKNNFPSFWFTLKNITKKSVSRAGRSCFLS